MLGWLFVFLFFYSFLNILFILSFGVISFIVEKERDRKVKSCGFWGFGRLIEKVIKFVFGVFFMDLIVVVNIVGLFVIVFRCIEYFEVKKVEDEEGIYCFSGSLVVIKGLKEKFDD